MLNHNQDICKKIKSALSDALQIDEKNLNEKEKFSQYSSLDSMGFVKLIITLNEIFDTELDTEKVLECDNILQLSIYIEDLLRITDEWRKI